MISRKFKCIGIIIVVIIVLQLLFVSNLYLHLFSINFLIRSNSFHSSQCSFSILTFNVHGSDQDFYFSERADNLYWMIINAKADFVLLNEYYSSCTDKLDSLLSQNYNFSSSIGRHDMYYGEMFYSKYPIDTIRVISDINSHCAIYNVSVTFDTIPISIYCCHLHSNNYDNDNNRVEYKDINTILGLNNYFDIYKTSSKKRFHLVKRMLDTIDNTSCKNVIIAGDMNDFSFSPVVQSILSRGFKDSWWTAGKGYGCTFDNGYLPLRIDYIFYSDLFLLNDVRIINSCGLSDHNALRASFIYSE